MRCSRRACPEPSRFDFVSTTCHAPSRRLVVSAAGFEPTAPGFIPLRLSPPHRAMRSWSGLSLRHGPACGRQAPPVQSLHLPDGSGLARDRQGLRPSAFPEFEWIHHEVSFMTPNSCLRNPVLYPAELRGHVALALPDRRVRGKRDGAHRCYDDRFLRNASALQTLDATTGFSRPATIVVNRH